MQFYSRLFPRCTETTHRPSVLPHRCKHLAPENVPEPQGPNAQVFSNQTCLRFRYTRSANGHMLLKQFNHLKGKQRRLCNCPGGPRGVNCGIVIRALLCRRPSTPSPVSKTTLSIKCDGRVPALSCFTVVKNSGWAFLNS